MRFTQSERMEIIRIVEHSDLGITKTLRELGVARSTFYEWYRRYAERGFEGLADAPPRRQCWNRIPDAERERVVELALELPELTPRELAWHVTDHEGAFISESSVYRILKGFDLVASPSFVVMSAKDKFQHPTRRVNELWQTEISCFSRYRASSLETKHGPLSESRRGRCRTLGEVTPVFSMASPSRSVTSLAAIVV